MDKTSIYESSRSVPPEAQKRIGGGRLNGMTDINPMWRIKKLTELFGPAGIGWKFDPPVFEEKLGVNGEVMVHCFTCLYIRQDDGTAWSAPIPGVGGSMLISTEKSGQRTDDEAYKKPTRTPRAWHVRRLVSVQTCIGTQMQPSTAPLQQGLHRSPPPSLSVPAVGSRSLASSPRTENLR